MDDSLVRIGVDGDLLLNLIGDCITDALTSRGVDGDLSLKLLLAEDDDDLLKNLIGNNGVSSMDNDGLFLAYNLLTDDEEVGEVSFFSLDTENIGDTPLM